METSPVTCRTLEDYYHINANTFDRQYKDVLSGFRTWAELDHADEWLVFPDNIGPRLAIDETSLSNGELYTVVTNRDRHGRDRCLVSIVRGVRSETVIKALKVIPDELLDTVGEVTLDLSESMKRIVRTCFPKAMRVIDRFHIQKLACDAVQEMRIKHRWDAIQEANDAMESAKLKDREYVPLRYKNGDTKAYGLCHSLRMIFSKNTLKDAARLSMARWYNKVEEAGFRSFKVIAATFRERYNDILNFYVNRSSNAAAESFNAKIKSFRASLRGIVDEKFFLYRLAKIYAYPH